MVTLLRQNCRVPSSTRQEAYKMFPGQTVIIWCVVLNFLIIFTKKHWWWQWWCGLKNILGIFDDQCNILGIFDDQCNILGIFDDHCNILGIFDDSCNILGIFDDQCNILGMFDDQCNILGMFDDQCTYQEYLSLSRYQEGSMANSTMALEL